MSFILDALKKSEAERQRQSLPGLVDAGVARPPPRLPVWVIAVVSLLVINLIVLVLLYLHHSQAEPAAANKPREALPAVNTATQPQRQAAKHFSPMDSAPPIYAQEIPADNLSAGSTRSPLVNPTPLPREVAHDVRPREPVLTEDYKPEDAEVLPTMNEMTLSGAQALPELHLDVHVYATKASDRFVYINMRKYHEKGTLQEGPTIEKIRRDGVVLDYRGVRFLLPRQ